MPKSRSLTDDQFDWYSSQPVEYRRQWWIWAVREHNFDRMVAEFVEEDESVIRFKKLALEKRRELDLQAVRAAKGQGDRVLEVPGRGVEVLQGGVQRVSGQVLEQEGGGIQRREHP